MIFKVLKLVIPLTCSLLLSAHTRADDQRWYFIRHFEKMSGENPGLTQQGQNRALQLADYFRAISLTAVYSTSYQRTEQTAQALVREQGLQLKPYHGAMLAELAKQLKVTSKVLVVGHSNTTPELVTLMGGEAQPMTESDYGQLFIVSSANGRIHTQVVEISL